MCDVLAHRNLAVELAQEDGNQGRLPVVAVHDVAFEFGHAADRLADGLAEEGIALAVVKVAIDAAVTLEIRLVVDEVEVDAVEGQLLDAAVDVAPREGHIEVGDVLHLLLVLPGDAAILGHDDGDFGASMLERARQGARDVSETARLDEGHRLGRGKEDLNLSSNPVSHDVFPPCLWVSSSSRRGCHHRCREARCLRG